MATNDFIGFASSGSANIMSQADYAAAAEQGDGVQPGMASSKLANKIWRQGANMAAALGRIASARGFDARDNGDLNTLTTNIDNALSLGAYNQMYFNQVSGIYTAPRTGVYRITLKGGGGGGGGAQTTTGRGGSGGGEGAINIVYVTLTKNSTYNFVIGAGGTAGASSATLADVTSGASGGNTYITVGGTTYTAYGGGGGTHSQTAAKGGTGGGITTGGYCIPGANGAHGVLNNTAMFPRAQGGGHRGANGADEALRGGGGGGASSSDAATAGADGYIFIEYAG